MSGAKQDESPSNARRAVVKRVRSSSCYTPLSPYQTFIAHVSCPQLRVVVSSAPIRLQALLFYY